MSVSAYESADEYDTSYVIRVLASSPLVFQPHFSNESHKFLPSRER